MASAVHRRERTIPHTPFISFWEEHTIRCEVWRSNPSGEAFPPAIILHEAQRMRPNNEINKTTSPVTSRCCHQLGLRACPAVFGKYTRVVLRGRSHARHTKELEQEMNGQSSPCGRHLATNAQTSWTLREVDRRRPLSPIHKIRPKSTGRGRGKGRE